MTTAHAAPSPEAAQRCPAWRQSRTALAVSTAARFVLGCALLLLVASVLPALAGWESSTVMSGSMEPTLSPGDVVVTRPVDPAALRPGQIVLVDDPDVPGALRMHRIVAVEDGALRLRGDANPAADGSLVAPAAVHGIGALRLPAIGLPVYWASQRRAVPLALTGVALAALLALALLHRSEDGGGPEATPRGRPRGRGQRSKRAVARGVTTGSAVVLGAAVVLAAPGLLAGAGARFTATASSATNSFAAAGYWSCAAAEGSGGANAAQALRLDETAGPTAANTGSSRTAGDGTYSTGGITYGVPGPPCGGTSSAITLDGATGSAWTTTAVLAPQTFSEQVWFSTTTTRGGKLLGFGGGAAGAQSNNYDRHLYLNDGGQLSFGVYDGSIRVITSPAAYNDGRWHLATATFSAGTGMRLYVDGLPVASNGSVTTAENTTGYWRIGFDNLGGWPGSSSYAYAGSLARVTVYDSVLSAAEVASQFRAAGSWSCAAPATSAGGATLAYPLQEAAGPTAVNSGSAGAGGNGSYSGSGITYGVPGPSCGSTVTSGIRLDGASGLVSSGQPVAGPQTFSVQLWFRTTSTTGGKLIGFGDQRSGGSTHYDRHVYMTNSGQLVFGVYNGSTVTVTTAGSYNDGHWHQVTATFSAGTGQRLYVDSVLVASGTTATSAEPFSGYWRIGYDSLGNWPSVPSSQWFAGSVAQFRVFDTVLSATDVAAGYVTGP